MADVYGKLGSGKDYVDPKTGEIAEITQPEEYSTASAFDNSVETLSSPEEWNYKPGLEALADSYAMKPTLKETAKLVASEAEWGKVLANQPKMNLKDFRK